jgi:ubiquinone/menaquinone biosynthesis C-methylase UbiE
MKDKSNVEKVLAETHWNESYRLRKTDHLWGRDPVPFVTKASKIFRETNCQIIADLPCGDGRNTVILAKGLPFVMGLDASQNALQLAQERIESEDVRNCVFQRCDIFQTNFQNEQFDGIFCWDVLGHLKAVNGAMDEIIRICRKGGRIIGTLFATSDPNLGSEMIALGENEYLYRDKYYYHFYTRQRVEEFVKRFPVEVLSLQLEKWGEPAHEGFREYPHEHHSWVFILKKN